MKRGEARLAACHPVKMLTTATFVWFNVPLFCHEEITHKTNVHTFVSSDLFRKALDSRRGILNFSSPLTILLR
jgi:hypothetical protein